MAESIQKGTDGYYHPSTEAELVGLVKRAHDEGLQIRVRGATHSVARAIYTDAGSPDKNVPNKVSHKKPPKGPHINIRLDLYRGFHWVDKDAGIVEVDAGIHLGVDPDDESTRLEDGFLYRIFEEGWALSDLGGITQQTVSGFLSTGSAGGSTTYDLGENLLGFRVIDGTGNVEWVTKESNEDLFNAVGLSFGLLGIISKIRFKLVPLYHVNGQEFVKPTSLDECPIDLFGDGNMDKPSLEEYFRKTAYSRILWWPQKKVDRVAIWQAVRGDATPVLDPRPYEQFGDDLFFAQLQQLAGGIVFTILGNRGFFKTWWKIRPDFKRFRQRIIKRWSEAIGSFLSTIFIWLICIVAFPLVFLIVLFFSLFRGLMVALFPAVVEVMQPFTRRRKSEVFTDYYWRSLPMDNNADDESLGTEFTEIFVSLDRTAEVMQLLKNHFDNGGYDATGFYAQELYAGYTSEFWLSPNYRQYTFRLDPFWYIDNDGDPSARDGFFAQFWELLKQHDIPFRLHWGKYLPNYDHAEWAAYYRSQYPRWDDFMELRRERDPKDIFLTEYWRLHLGLQPS